jgi:glycosyltransferase involved in cell wall biosynthesis
MNARRTLRVALDATPLSLHTGGIRRYLVELVQALAQMFPEDEYHLLSDRPGGLGPVEWTGLSNVQIHQPHLNRATKRWWSVGLPLELLRRQIDVFHGVDFSIPYLPRQPSVLTLHDLSPWQITSVQSVGSSRIRRRTPFLTNMATRFITPSDAIRCEVAGFFSVPKSRIFTTHLAPSTSLSIATLDNTEDTDGHKFQVKAPYLLYVGSTEPRKNLTRLIKAWRIARTEIADLSLVLVGTGHTCEREIFQERGLHLPGYLSDKEIAHLLSRASAFVYPSLYEGFGLPVLEAMQAAVPVITSSDAAITEVTAGAALQVDAKSQDQLGAAILRVIRDPHLRLQLQNNGRQRAQQFSWRSTAILTRAVYVDAIRSF